VKLPNSYLSEIAEHGAQYTKLNSSRVTLYQSQGYSMKKPEDQAAFYIQLTKLLWYLSSGKSHVGYLNNLPSNPFAPEMVFSPGEFPIDG
jgi:hypothetical protein